LLRPSVIDKTIQKNSKSFKISEDLFVIHEGTKNTEEDDSHIIRDTFNHTTERTAKFIALKDLENMTDEHDQPQENVTQNNSSKIIEQFDHPLSIVDEQERGLSRLSHLLDKMDGR
jgi:hypothetical protein